MRRTGAGANKKQIKYKPRHLCTDPAMSALSNWVITAEFDGRSGERGCLGLAPGPPPRGGEE